MTSKANNIDPELILLVPFVFSILIAFNLMNGDLGVIDLSETVIESETVTYTWAHTIALASLLAVLFNRENSLMENKSATAVEIWIVIATFGFLLAPPFVPEIEQFFNEQAAAMVAVFLQTIGFVLVSYMN